MSSKPLPDAFYRGKAKARRAAALSLVLIIASSSVLGAGGQSDLLTVLGPHVQGSEWAFTMTGARALNSQGLTGRGVTVCIVDSGLDILHPDFAHLHLLAWRDLVNFKPDPYDDNGHGTAMAGLIAADGSIRGVAPEVSLIVVKALNSGGNGSPQNVADGISFCVDPYGNGQSGSDIISLSLGSRSFNFFDTTVYNAVAWATSRGVFVVVAAGNDGLADDGEVAVAGQVPLAIAVGAVDSNGLRAPFSSIGSSLNRTDPNLKPELVAPGVQLVSTSPGAHYITITGTSPATALVAGILALILQARPSLRPGYVNDVMTVKMALSSGARKAPGQLLPHDPWYGYGIVDGLGTLSRL